MEVSLVLLSLLLLLVPSSAQMPGFVSLDCGGKEIFTDDLGLEWTPDQLDYGETTSVAVSNETRKQYSTLRHFPVDLRKYCYTLNVTSRTRYLLRATFLYGNYDSNNVYPIFDISVGATHWSSIVISDANRIEMRELIFLATSPTVSVCLSNATTGQPFISTLELRQFNGSMYYSEFELQFYLSVSARINFGADDEAPVRYPDDPFDRIWTSDSVKKANYLVDIAAGTKKVSTKLPIAVNKDDRPPEKVMQTAVVGTNGTLTYRLNLVGFPGFGWAATYFAEIEDLAEDESRKFRLVLSGNTELSKAVVNIEENAQGKYRLYEPGFTNMSFPFVLPFKFAKTPDSSRGPLLNAVEINKYLKINDGSQDGTVISSFVSQYSSADWTLEGGDPCLPVQWSWVECNSDPQPRIVKIKLSSKNITGNIPSDLTKLSSLEELWLDGNSLAGTIPDFTGCVDLKIIHLENNQLTGGLSSFTNLRSLKELYVQNNMLNGTVPSGLLDKGVNMNYTGNVNLRKGKTSGSHNNIIIGTSVGAAVLVIATIVSCVLLRKGRKKFYKHDQHGNQPAQGIRSSKSDAPNESAHCFSYSEIEEATRNFEKKIGSGGFGVVYYGKLKDEKEIAVKVLSSNSYQGKREFSNEVTLLSRIHHRNLVQFLGYCQEDGRSMLIYEFMHNGTLKEHLYGPLTHEQSINWINETETENPNALKSERRGYMDLRQRPQPARGGRGPIHAPLPPMERAYNIIPIHDLIADHPSLRYPEVRAAAAALRAVGDLRKPPFIPWNPSYDLMDWLGLFFGFQIDNVRNQREHLVLHLANSQMRLQPPPNLADSLEPSVLKRFRRKLLHNYNSWCSYLGRKSSVVYSRRRGGDDLRRELLYVALFLLIWGESGNVRFVPECVCYIYHHMAMELNKVLDEYTNPDTGGPFLPSVSGDCGYLKSVVMPIYQTIKTEVESSRNGTAPHSAWRNYDDINEYFWSRRCFKKLKWPIKFDSNFFATTPKDRRVGKTGFVEQRSFWNLFRSFDKLWVMLILFLQAAIIVAWKGTEYPWQALDRRDDQVQVLTVFITWSGLRLLQAVLDAGTQYSLVSKETMLLGVRMVLKGMAAATWTIVFSVFYAQIWAQKNEDGRWSAEANRRIVVFLEAALVFIVPELLALVLFIVPWVRNFLEELDFSILYVFTWWFHTRIFVGRGLREGLVSNIKYTLFWIAVLGSKFSFSYFLQIKPLVSPTKALLDIKDFDYKIHLFFGGGNRIAIVFLWIPVVLIYFMDLQIWFAIYQSLIGATIGLFSHLGEIRNIKQLRLRFQFFASALQFNLMPEEESLRPEVTAVKKLREAIHRLKLRYGLGQAYKKTESSQVEATRFALIWNEIMTTFREEDLISDRELELLELPPNCWNIRVIRWPCCLLCNELLLALSQAKETGEEHDRLLWLKICKNEYRRCAVIEAYDSIKYLLSMVVKHGTEENSIVKVFFREIDQCIRTEKVTVTYKMSLLPQIHAKLISLIELLMQQKKDVSKVVDVLQALYELSVREFPWVKKTMDTLRMEGLAPRSSAADADFLFEKAVNFPDDEDAVFFRHLRRLHTILTSRDSMHNVPMNLEARRRIAFFSNSLFMNMPRAPYVEKMMAFSVLTPYYDEEVLYGKEALRSENEDGISTLFYLQKIYADEWTNFMERMHRQGLENDDEIFKTKARDLRVWASFRGQTLSRTVRGMMYYYRALKMLAFLDTASEMDIRDGSQQVGSHVLRSQSSGLDGIQSGMLHSSRKLGRTSSSVSYLFKGNEHGIAMLKFTYVVACQVYGQHKAKGDYRAEEILYLMKNNEALRVAYVDEVHLGRDEVEYYSVLVKYDQEMQREVEIYRIRLPGPLKLGEGKPENQNHAIIFTRGDAIQTIDMNQDNYFEEALKMRNLLEEFKRFYGIRKPTILGVRENIFTGSVSSLAWFMSAQEMSFVTLNQRVLANPLKVRMHYGHPDVFDRFWFLPRGGISKASKVINISEDIFAGFNCTLRGGNVTHHEYIQVGKGRDVGLNQISMFEAKVASGNGEQVLSRDVYRLGHRLDFFRMLSFFYSTVGFYFNTMMVILTVYSFLWGRLFLSLSGIEDMTSNNNKSLGVVLNQQFIIQLGLFTALPMIVENSLEQGFLRAVWDFLTMQLQLASTFYTFSMGTRTHFFGRTILHGGAKYRATGRGFVVEHKSFAENYRLYSRSHFVKAIELGIILIVYAAHSSVADTFVYVAMSISSWCLVLSWIMAPFVFNPSGFDWLKTVYDFDDFMNWLWYSGGVFTKAEQSWETWWYEEQDHLRTTGLWGKLLEIILDLRFFFFQYGVVYQLGITGGNTSIAVYLLSWIYMVVAVGIYIVLAYAQDKYAAKDHVYYRLVQLIVIIALVLVAVLLIEFTKFKFLDIISSLLAFIPTGYGIILIAQVLRPFLQSTVVWDTVVSLARLYDLIFGVIVMAPVALLSWLPGFQSMQTRILFNEAFSRGLQISRILTGKKSQ